MPTFYDMKTFDFDDVRLLPSKCVVGSRSEVSTDVTLGKKTFKLPVVPANMSTIVDERLSVKLAREGYFYIMHRFGVNPVAFTKKMHKKGLYSSISLGIKQSDKDALLGFSDEGITPEYVTIDVAHGHSQAVIDMVKKVRLFMPETYIIAGNVATPDAAYELAEAGANAIKVGVGPGAVCLTAPNTGFGSRDWQLSSIANIAEKIKKSKYAGKIDIIADGGIREYGDIAKAIAFGSKMIMIGGMFAGHKESPGRIIITSAGDKMKTFFGSASEHQKGESRYVEGKKIYVPYKGPISETLRTIKENLQSSVSYAGGNDLSSLEEVEYVLLNNR